MSLANAEELELKVPGGRLEARRYGPVEGPLVLCVPGLSANLMHFGAMAPGLAEAGLQVVAVDLRGRGRSEVTPPGTYGWPAHARDVLGAAEALGRSRFTVAGWSMGAYVAMAAATQARERLDRVVLIDALGDAPAEFVTLLDVSLSRLGNAYPSLPDYLALVRGAGPFTPWSEDWERYFEYEMAEVAGGVRTRTSAEAVREDLEYGKAHHADQLWGPLTMPVLLVRATRPSMEGMPLVIPPDDRDRFLASHPNARCVEVEATHYNIGFEPAAITAVREFLTS
ncbi:MAG TPA: alpha/beta fold hydrolase [Candidatus Dormibacteraeota bacterium]